MIQYMKNDTQNSTVQLRRVIKGIDTVLEDSASEYELFLTDEYFTQQLLN